MYDARPRQVELFRHPNGSEPFTEWLNTIRDSTVRARINHSLNRVKLGNFSDCQSISDGISELRLHHGPGYRIYFIEKDYTTILVLCGGIKRSQKSDIRTAKSCLLEHRRNQ